MFSVQCSTFEVSLTLLLFQAAVAASFGQPAITQQPTNFDLVSLGASVGNRVGTSGTAPLAYQWRLNGVPVPRQTNSTLTLTNLQLADAGDYTVLVTNLAGSITSRVVTLHIDTTFTKITTGPGELEPVLAYCSGPTWWDYDNDGFLDLFVAYGAYSGPVRNQLYHNNQDGTFTRLTNELTTTLGVHLGGVVGDFDNDGNEDLFVMCSSGVHEFYRNEGAGSFTRLTQQQAGPVLGDTDSTADVAWVDYDRDGFLDLFRANGPFSAASDCLYRNNGDGTFTRMTTNEVGQIVNDRAATWGCAWADYDNDGWPDLRLDNQSGNDLLYHNDQGFFRKVTDPNNSIVQQAGGSGAAAWGDYDNDGFLDLFVPGVFSPHTLHRNLGGLSFTNVTSNAGIPSTHRGQGATWADYDNDGFLDLFVTADPPYPCLLLRNNGDGTFTSVDVGSPIHDGTAHSRWGMHWGDYDNDGFLDLAVACMGAANLLFHNNGNSNAWIKVKLVGTASNRSAIGAKVRVQAAIRGRQMRQMREISGNSSWSGGTAGLPAHFGLGDAANVDWVRIEWPSGIVQDLTNVPARQMLTITEPYLPHMVQPAGLDAPRGTDVTFGLTNNGAGAYAYQWRLNGADLAGETNDTLPLFDVQTNQGGAYSVWVSDGTYSLVAHPGRLRVWAGPLITSQPSDQFVRPGSNATFQVVAQSPWPIGYQWQFSGSDISGATNATLTVSNVSLADAGAYHVTANDESGSAESLSATLTVLILPVILRQPCSQSMVAGGSVTLSVAVTNTATLPVGYRWRKGTTTLTNFLLNDYLCFLTLTNVQATTNYSVAITNLATSSSRLSSNAWVTVLTDVDGDGLPDQWESDHGISQTTTNHATADDDGDGMTNLQEYIAGTDPTNALSYLKVESIALAEGGNAVVLHFLAVSNRTYTIRYRSAADGGGWGRLVDVAAAPTNRVVEVRDAAEAAGAQRFYRLVTPRAP